MSADAQPTVVSLSPGTPFVGREGPLRAICDAVDGAVERRQGRLLLVSGEPGIGKTTLVREALRRVSARRTLTALWGRCVSGEGSPPFWPWTHALRSYVFEHPREDLDDEVGADAALLLPILPELRVRYPDLAQPAGSESEQTRFRLFDRFTAFLQIAAATEPLVVVLEDLHWADAASLRVLEFVARELGDSSLTVIATYRDGESTMDLPLQAALGALLRERTTERIALSGLQDDDCLEIAQGLIGEPISAAASRVIRERTTGNPLYVGEVVRWLAGAGRLAIADRPEAWATGFPDGLRELISRRLVALGSQGRTILQHAAVIGTEFDLDLLERVLAPRTADSHDAERITATLDDAIRLQVIAVDERSPERLRFTHALVAEALRSEVVGARRARLHAEIGLAIESLRGAHLARHAEELVLHFRAAGIKYADRVLRYARLGAEAAMTRCAYEEAARHLGDARRALESCEPGNAELRAELGLWQAKALLRAGQLGEARVGFDEVISYARRQALPDLLAEAAVARAHVVPEVGKSDPHLCALLEEALAGLGTAQASLRSRLAARLAMEMWPVDPMHATELARSSITLSRESGDPTATAYAYYAVSGGDFGLDRAAAAAEMLAVGQRTDDPELVSEARVQRLRLRIGEGDPAGAEGEIEAMERLAAESRQPRHAWIAHLFRTSWLISRGHFAEGEHWAFDTAALGQRAQEPNADQVFSAHLFTLRGYQGRLEEICPALEALAAEHPDLLWWSIALAHCYGEMDELERAAAVVASIQDLEDRLTVRHGVWLVMLGLLSRVIIATRDVARARILHPLIAPFTGRNVVDDISNYGSADLHIGALAGLLGRDAEARAHLERALTMNRRMSALTHVAETLWVYGRYLRDRAAAADSDQGARLLAEGREIGGKIGMARLVVKVDEILGVRNPAAEAEALLPPPTVERSAPDAGRYALESSIFRREGEYWTVTFGGTVARVRDAKAMGYLQRLLREPGREFHVSDLAGAHATGTARDTSVEWSISSLDDAPLPDEQARAAYRKRLGALREDLAEAESHNDPVRASALTAEIEFLTTELTQTLRRRGHALQKGPLESMRSAVTKAIRRQLAKIQQDNAPLGRHLDATLRIGILCAYAPPTPIPWLLD